MFLICVSIAALQMPNQCSKELKTTELKPVLCDCLEGLDGMGGRKKVQKRGDTCITSSVGMLSCVRLFVTPWTVACQVPLSIEISWQEYWSGLPFFCPGDIPNPRIPQPKDCTYVSCISCTGRWILYHLHHLARPSGKTIWQDQTYVYLWLLNIDVW